jgi:hypothetical protein
MIDILAYGMVLFLVVSVAGIVAVYFSSGE